MVGAETVRALPRSVVALNVAGLAVSAVFTVRGLRRPETAVPDGGAPEAADFWSEFAAARTLPLTGLLAVQLLRSNSSTALPALLAVAGVAQLGDAVIGARRSNRPMTIAPALMGAVHLVSARRALNAPQVR